MNVVGFQSCRYSGFLHALQHAVIDLLIAVDFLFEDIVLNRVLVEFIGLQLLLLDRFLQQFFPLHRGSVGSCEIFHPGFTQFHKLLLRRIQLP